MEWRFVDEVYLDLRRLVILAVLDLFSISETSPYYIDPNVPVISLFTRRSRASI